jgi:hypothetical protein
VSERDESAVCRHLVVSAAGAADDCHLDEDHSIRPVAIPRQRMRVVCEYFFFGAFKLARGGAVEARGDGLSWRLGVGIARMGAWVWILRPITGRLSLHLPM